MSLSLILSPFLAPPQKAHFINFPLARHEQRFNVSFPSKFRTLTTVVRSVHDDSSHLPVTPAKPRWENVLSTAASLYPLYVTVGGVVACLKPSTFAWFAKTGPGSYSLSLGLIMLAMGLTLELKDLVGLFMQRPLSVSVFSCWSILLRF